MPLADIEIRPGHGHGRIAVGVDGERVRMDTSSQLILRRTGILSPAGREQQHEQKADNSGTDQGISHDISF